MSTSWPTIRLTVVALLVSGAVLVFAPSSFGEGVLLVSLDGTGAGRVTNSLGWIDCTPTCSLTRGVTTTATLEAIAAPGSEFAGWHVTPPPGSEPPNPFFTPIANPIVDGCGVGTTCTVEVASSPDMLDPTCAPTPGSCGIIATFAYTRVTATFVDSVSNSPGIFLCYSKWQVDPGVWPLTQARALYEAGYWRPYAVHAPLTSTRLAGFTLVCNLPAGMTVVGNQTIDAGGATFDHASFVDSLGYYRRAS